MLLTRFFAGAGGGGGTSLGGGVTTTGGGVGLTGITFGEQAESNKIADNTLASLLPFNSSRGFRANIVNHSINASHFIDDGITYMG